MPKKVDPEERRRLIADALMRVAAEQGLESVSLRHVATQAGVSAGMVQHYFRTRDEMMALKGKVPDEAWLARREELRAAAAAKALLRNTELTPGEIVRQALTIAAEIDVYTNDNLIVEELPAG